MGIGTRELEGMEMKNPFPHISNIHGVTLTICSVFSDATTVVFQLSNLRGETFEPLPSL